MTDAVDVAATQLGAPYVWGAKGPGQFDCSGFVSWCEAQVGVGIASYTDTIAGDTPQVLDMQRGDLLLYRYNDPQQPGTVYPHVEFVLDPTVPNTIGARWPDGVAERPILDRPYEIHRPGGPVDQVVSVDVGATGVQTAGGQAPAVPWYVWAGAGLAVLWAIDLL